MPKPWTPPEIWKNQPCIIIGGGISFGVLSEGGAFTPGPGIDIDLIKRHRVIGCNNAYELGPEIVDACYFGDCRWFFKWNNKEKLLNFSGLKVSCCPDLYNETRIKLLRKFAPGILPIKRGKPNGMDTRKGLIGWNMNTGASAINLAYHFGCRKIVLVGFDWKSREKSDPIFDHYRKLGVDLKLKEPKNVHNWHDHHLKPNPEPTIYKKTFERFLVNVADDCKRLKVDVINATHDSALDLFSKMPLREALNQ
jgi:hypothetical protein